MRQRSTIPTTRVAIHAGGRGYAGNPGDDDDDPGDSYESIVGYERPATAGDKLGNSLKGLLLGPLAVALGCWLLWSNEAWAIKTHRSLDQALDAHVSITNALHRPQHVGKLVHLTHRLTVDGGVTDPMFDLSRAQAVALHRRVEIYQWVETRHTEKVKNPQGQIEHRETVNYKRQWVPAPIDSARFQHQQGHQNCCGSLPVSSQSWWAAHVQMGVYVLSDALTNQLEKVNVVPSSEAKSLPQGAHRSKSSDALYLPRVSYDRHEETRDLIQQTTMRVDGAERTVFVVKATGDSYSNREKALAAAQAAVSSLQPEIGDVRISFSEVPCEVVSVLAKLGDDNVLTTWQSPQGSGYNVALLHYGTVTATDMIQTAQSNNTVKTWVLRAGGWFLNFIGYTMITSIVSTTADITLHWIPLLGPMTTSLIHLGLTVANLVLANSTALLVASMAWVFYRPSLGIGLLAGSLGLFFTASHLGKLKGKDLKSR